MSYLTQSHMARDYGLIMRIAACAAVEGGMPRPESWADDRRIGFMASPGWATAYAESQARYNAAPEGEKPPLPGEDETAITDEMIRTEVLKVLAAETPPPEPEPETPSE